MSFRLQPVYISFILKVLNTNFQGKDDSNLFTDMVELLENLHQINHRL